MVIKRWIQKGKSMIKIKKDNGVDSMKDINRYCSIEDSIETSLKQMKLIKNGNIPKKSWKDLCSELKKEED